MAASSTDAAGEATPPLISAECPVPAAGRDGKLPGAVVVGGSHGTLAVIRSLGRLGVPVLALVHEHPIVRYSRYTWQWCDWPGPSDPGAAAFLLDLAHRLSLGGWLLIAGGDAEARLIGEHHAALSAVYRVLSLPWERLKWAYDKRLMYQHAADLGLAHPRIFATGEPCRWSEKELAFPLVIKPAVRDHDNALTREKAWMAGTHEDLALFYERAVDLMGGEGVIVQEMVPGDGRAQFSYAAVWHEGAPVASLVAQRLRQYPRRFGFTSTFVETVEEPAVEEAACRFLRSLGYSGLVEVEFKRDDRDGSHKILDVNTRAWTWIALGSVAGTDFPAILWRLANGMAVAPVRASPGVAWVHFSRDLAIALPDMAAGRLSAVAYLRSMQRTRAFAAHASDDLLPGLLDFPLLVPRLLRRLVRLMPGPAAPPPHLAPGG